MALKSEDNKYIKAGVGYTIGNYLLKGISFLTLPIFVRLMTQADYGNFNTYAAYESIFCIIVGLALHTSLKNAKYKYGEEGFDSYVSSCIQIGIVSTIIFLIIANITYPLYAGIIDMSRGIFNLLIVESYSVSVITTYNVYISLSYRYKSFLIVSFINVIMNIALSLLFMFTFLSDNRYLARVLGTATPVIVISIVIVIHFLRVGKIQFVSEHWKYALGFSVPLILHGVSQVILNQFDRIMIKTMTGAVDAGIYSFAYNISSLVLVTSTSLQQVWSPWFYEKMATKEYKEIQVKGDQFAFGMFLFVVCVLCGAEEIIKILGTKEYVVGLYYLIPILVGGYFAFLYILPAQAEYYYEKTNYIATGTCVAAILNVIMNYVGVRMFGSIAAAYTTLIIYMLYFCIHYYLAIKVHGASLFMGRKLFIYSVLLFCVAAFSLICNNNWIIRWLVLVATGLYLLYWLNKEYAFVSLMSQKVRRTHSNRKV